MSVYNKTPYIVSVLSSLTQELQNALQVLIDTKSEPKLYSLINDDYKITTEDKGVKFIQLECNDKVITGYLVYNNTYCVIFGFNASQKVEIYNVDYANRKIEKIEEECSILEFRAVLEHLSLAASAGLKREIVEELPEEDIDPNVIYMVLDSEATGDNVYNEYLYIGNAWELIGNTGVVETGNTIAWANIDLTSGTASKTPTEAEWLLMTDDESDCKLVLTLSTNEVVRLERVSLTSSTVLFSAVASDIRYTATFTESDNALSGVITAKDTSVQGNPTIPAGATVNDLNALKIGSNYFNIDKPIHFIKLTSTTLTGTLMTEILSDDYFVILEYDNEYYYERSKDTSLKIFETMPYLNLLTGLNSYQCIYKETTIYDNSLSFSITTKTFNMIKYKALPQNIAGKENSGANVSAGKVLTADGSGGTSWENVSSGTEVEANVTIPSGATPSDLINLKIGSNYFNNDKPIHFIKLASSTLTSELISEILSDDYIVVLEYNNKYYYERSKTETGKNFNSMITSSSGGSGDYDQTIAINWNAALITNNSNNFNPPLNTLNLIKGDGVNVPSYKINSKTNSSTNATAGKVLTADGSGGTSWENVSQLGYLTTAPTQDNTSGVLQIVVLSSEPATKYNGYLYLITGA